MLKEKKIKLVKKKNDGFNKRSQLKREKKKKKCSYQIQNIKNNPFSTLSMYL